MQSNFIMLTDGIEVWYNGCTMDTPINKHAQRRRGATKVCNDCSVEFPEMEFMKWFSPQRKRMRRSPYCHKCRLERHRVGRLARTYNLSAQDYDDMFARQDGKCAICFRKPQKIFIDHCHKTGKNRELLCINCNSLIGQAKDDIRILQSAIKYLETHS